jgi:hypothetical protein
VNGLKFKDADELTEQLVVSACMHLIYHQLDTARQALFSQFPDTNRLDALRQGLNKRTRISTPSSMTDEGQHQWNDWTDNWNAFVRPVLLHGIDYTTRHTANVLSETRN